MANTGRKIILTLKEVTDPGGVPTGNTKPNVPEDPDYIPPEFPSPDCPVVVDLACPSVIYTGKAGSVEYEFSMPSSAYANPSIYNVVVKLLSGVTLIDSDAYANISTLPNYFHGNLSATAGTYTISVEYSDISATLLQTCSAGPVIIT